MNKQGHADTLVAAHPGNANALKSGVFSEAARAQRVQELEAAIAERGVSEVVIDVLRREVAALAAVGELMDASFAQDGIRGRNGEPKNLVTLRLRLNDRVRRTLHDYAQATAERHTSAEHTAQPNAGDDRRETLIEAIADFHFRNSINEIAPRDLEPEAYLRAMITTTDPRVTDRVRLDARKMLTKRNKQRGEMCMCVATLRARNEIELREWIDELRDVPDFEPSPNDARLATFVRAMARGDRSELPTVSRQMEQAFRAVVSEGVVRALEPEKAVGPRRRTGEGDGAIRRFWETVLSPQLTLPAKDRLRALGALEELDVLPKCTCAPTKRRGTVLHEMKTDGILAYVIRIVAERHYRAAIYIAAFPETFVAVRDAIDDAIVQRQRAAAESAA